MISKTKIKVFYEPIIDKHPAELYISELTATPVPFKYAVTRAGHTKYDIEGFLVVDGVLNEEEVVKGKSELQSMTSADDPQCEAIWYEGGISHLLPDATTEKKAIGKGVGDALALGRQDTQLADLPGHLRAAYVRKFMGFLDAHADLQAIAYHPKLLALVETILEVKPELFQEMAMIKPPGGREKPWHQDHAYFNYDLETRIVGVWIPLGDATPDNGCMFAIRGGHKQGPRPHVVRRDWQLCDNAIETNDRICIPMRAGEIMIFDGKLPHGTPVNKTDQFRWALQFHYKARTAVAVADEIRLEAFGSEGKNVTC